MADAPATHDFSAIQLICDGERITGFATDGGVVIAPLEDAITTTVGADGRVVLSKSNNKTALATVTLHQGSAGAIKLGQLLALQDASTAAQLPVFTFQYTNPTTGEEVSTDTAAIQGRPDVVGNATVSDVVYVIVLPNAYQTAVFGESAA